MTRRTSAIAAFCLLIVVPFATGLTAQGAVTWLILVDDLHLDFRNTGRMRDLLRLLASELVHDGDWVAVHSTGPSRLQLQVSQDRTLASATIKTATGNALKLSDVDADGRKEARFRADVALLSAEDAVRMLSLAPPGRRVLVYLSNGYDGRDVAAVRVEALVRSARAAGVTIVAIDPRELPRAISGELSAGPELWSTHLTATRQTLRTLSEQSGGLLLFEAADLPQAVKDLSAAMRK